MCQSNFRVTSAVVSADTHTAVLMNHSGPFTTTSISCLFVEATFCFCHKLLGTVCLLNTLGTVWPVKVMSMVVHISFFSKTFLHYRRRSSSVISMSVKDWDSSSLNSCLKSSDIWEKKVVNLERSSSPDKKPKRQSTHSKTPSPLCRILRESFGLWDAVAERLMGLSWISCADVAATMMTSPRVWKNNYCAKPLRGRLGGGGSDTYASILIFINLHRKMLKSQCVIIAVMGCHSCFRAFDRSKITPQAVKMQTVCSASATVKLMSY